MKMLGRSSLFAEAKPVIADCDINIYEKGSTVFVVGDWTSEKMDEWVKKVAKQSGEKVDWHYEGGRARIRGLGDLEKIRNTIKAMLPELNEGITAHKKSIYGFSVPVNYKDKDVDQWTEMEMYREWSLTSKP